MKTLKIVLLGLLIIILSIGSLAFIGKYIKEYHNINMINNEVIKEWDCGINMKEWVEEKTNYKLNPFNYKGIETQTFLNGLQVCQRISLLKSLCGKNSKELLNLYNTDYQKFQQEEALCTLSISDIDIKDIEKNILKTREERYETGITKIKFFNPLPNF